MNKEFDRIVTRFAPSPTGFLHIGGARTALFNWLYARHMGGKFLLRIEDTDRARSTQEAIEAIIKGMKWLGLEWDEDIVFQSMRDEQHAAAANLLLKSGKAYWCYTTPQELEAMRAKAKAEGRPMRYDGRWRDRDPKEAPVGIKPAIRLKMPQSGQTVIQDQVQGEVMVANEQLDDMVLLRADGTPTYMLSVVVDDHDMGITHVIRGDDHLTNAFRQTQLYTALGWDVPTFAHIPLIHGPDGGKLSKRHGALGIEAYREMGFLPEAMRNYLLRLGWGHGDDEIIPTQKAVEWFDLSGIGRSPSRFDMAKLTNLNAFYMKEADDECLLSILERDFYKSTLNTLQRSRLLAGMSGLKVRAKTLRELADLAAFYIAERPLVLKEAARKILDEDALALLADLSGELRDVTDWTTASIEDVVRQQAEKKEMKLGKLAQPLRAALTGSNVSPGVFEVMAILGKEETLARIDDTVAKRQSIGIDHA